ncbi:MULTISPECIES: hypothetical protein [Kitasatospora]|uniref:Integral membrane protein n=1 Tax=Kitasatospora cathayae TaxID=3004092 RepID=A0ABY7Q711_9ACTN|nr:hypothetical protein [Kitasatospora sp. HUAS 3-15]WBP88473.1 hypothetical protein O1G21_23275 [Kitasatospora sp. HUAS 3-15]
MSYPPDPNNPYGQPQAPGYGYPQQAPPAAPGYGYPQPAAPAYGYAPAVPQAMPGLVMTARVLLFIVGGVQILITIGLMIGAAGAKKAADTYSSSSANAIFNATAGVALVLGIVFLLASVLSITVGVKFGRGGNATRITTIVYGSIALLIGLFLMFGAITGSTQATGDTQAAAQGAGFAMVFSGLWIAICIVWIVAMCVRDGVNWFNRPRY